MKTSIRSILFSAMAGAALCTSAMEMDFTYNTDNLEYKAYGYDKKETYDVAIRVADPTLVGARITGLSVDIPVAEAALADISGWLSTELKLEKKKNAPDICSAPASYSDYKLIVKFDEPYTVTDAGIYVGYTFSITDLSKEYDLPGSPIAVVEGKNPDGLFVHTSRTRLKWQGISESIGYFSPIVVHLDTDASPYDAAVTLPKCSYMERGHEGTVKAVVTNHGENPLTSMTYSYSLAGLTGEGAVKLPEPIEKAGESAVVNLPLQAIAETGTYDLKVTVLTVNGQENLDPYRSATASMVVMPFTPVTHPLVEEFTGLRCGWCPRGFVALEEMNRRHGDMFVAMAYHSESYESLTGNMVALLNSDFPVDVSGFPSADINRGDVFDPSMIPDLWPGYLETVSPADIDVDLSWTDTEKTSVTATSRLRFIQDMQDADYSLAVALVADNMSNPAWGQSNNFAGGTPEGSVDSEFWNPFINGRSVVHGLTFNDVVVYFKDVKGMKGVIPANITADEEISFNYTVLLDDILTAGGTPILTPDARLRAVAILLDGKTGVALNCNKSAAVNYAEAGGNTAAEEIASDAAEVVSTEVFDLSGRRLTEPASGICLIRETLADGNVRTRKATLR